jgi:hypothetical protein
MDSAAPDPNGNEPGDRTQTAGAFAGRVPFAFGSVVLIVGIANVVPTWLVISMVTVAIVLQLLYYPPVLSFLMAVAQRTGPEVGERLRRRWGGTVTEVVGGAGKRDDPAADPADA